MLDRQSTHEITVADIINVFDVSKDPEWIERRQTKEQILTAFLNNFDGAKGNNDGVISYDEFVDYYSDISMNLPGDDYFVAMMESTW
jgi:calcyphosin